LKCLNQVGITWQAVSLVADWRKLVPALQCHGPHRVLLALNVPLPRQRGAGSRGAKLRALERSELGDGERLVVSSPRSAAEEEAQAAREARYAALTFGLSAFKLSRMETACLAPLLTSPAQTRRILLLRNEILRRQRSKIQEGGLDGPWCLSIEEATAGLGGVGSRSGSALSAEGLQTGDAPGEGGGALGGGGGGGRRRMCWKRWLW